MKSKVSIAPLAFMVAFMGILPMTAQAETQGGSLPTSADGSLSTSADGSQSSWVDDSHSTIKGKLKSWSHTIDGWIGEPDPDEPASARLRIILDQEWNHYDGYSIKPRIRGKIKLPTLKKHLSVVFGDEDLDNEAKDPNQTSPNYNEALGKDEKYDKKQARNDNASIALRWSDELDNLGIKTDLDLGVRHGADFFVRGKIGKTWKHTNQFSTSLEQIARYGVNSKYYLRTNLKNKFEEDEQHLTVNHTYLEYANDYNDEDILWGNSLYRQHNYENHKRLNYGLFVGGRIDDKNFHLNTYGPFINWRQPLFKKWFFIQPEAHYYNDKEEDCSHHLGLFLRLEAIF